MIIVFSAFRHHIKWTELNLNVKFTTIGLALITMNGAFLWTDGRYFLQAAQQLSDQWKLMRMGEDPAVDIWMADVSKPSWFLTIGCIL